MSREIERDGFLIFIGIVKYAENSKYTACIHYRSLHVFIYFSSEYSF